MGRSGEFGSFEQQIVQKDVITVDTKGATALQLSDVRPGETSAPPVLFVPSVLTIDAAKRLTPAMREFWNQDRRTLAVEHTPRGVRGADKAITSRRPAAELSKLELGRAAALLAALDDREIEQADVVGHCEGGLNATYLALLKPERVRTLTLVNPAGIGETSLSRAVLFFATRTVRDLGMKALDITGIHRTSPKKYRPLLHAGSNPLFQPNIYTLANVRVDPLLQEIEDNGVPIGIVKSANDAFYPIEDALYGSVAETVSEYAVLEDPRAKHDPLANLPAVTVQTISDMQTRMATNSQ